MAVKRMDNVGIVVNDMDAAIDFFGEIGLELEGRGTFEGPWMDRTIDLDGAKCEIAMLRPPDGRGGVELSRFIAPPPASTEPANAPVNTLGYLRVMFEVDDLRAVVTRLEERQLAGSSPTSSTTRTSTCSATSGGPRGSWSAWPSHSARRRDALARHAAIDVPPRPIDAWV